MKKNIFLKIILFLIVALSVATYTSNIWDDDEANAFPAFAIVDFFPYGHLTSAILRGDGLFLPARPDFDLSQSKIFYIKMHEKSPPALFSFPSV